MTTGLTPRPMDDEPAGPRRIPASEVLETGKKDAERGCWGPLGAAGGVVAARPAQGAGRTISAVLAARLAVLPVRGAQVAEPGFGKSPPPLNTSCSNEPVPSA